VPTPDAYQLRFRQLSANAACRKIVISFDYKLSYHQAGHFLPMPWPNLLTFNFAFTMCSFKVRFQRFLFLTECRSTEVVSYYKITMSVGNYLSGAYAICLKLFKLRSKPSTLWSSRFCQSAGHFLIDADATPSIDSDPYQPDSPSQHVIGFFPHFESDTKYATRFANAGS
jgi:hypothetical protein